MCTPFGDLTNVSHDLKLLSLVQRLRYVHHSQATTISYTLLVADYWSSTARLSYKQLWHLPSTPDTLNLGCSYHLHSGHCFLSTWDVVMLEKKNNQQNKVTCMQTDTLICGYPGQKLNIISLHVSIALPCCSTELPIRVGLICAAKASGICASVLHVWAPSLTDYTW